MRDDARRQAEKEIFLIRRSWRASQSALPSVLWVERHDRALLLVCVAPNDLFEHATKKTNSSCVTLESQQDVGHRPDHASHTHSHTHTSEVLCFSCLPKAYVFQSFPYRLVSNWFSRQQ